jgi:DNA-binding NtrC family response regulator
VLLAQGGAIGAEAIELVALPAHAPAPGAATAPVAAVPADPIAALVGRRMEEVERELILETLGRCLGNRTRAAEILGISIRTLRNKLAEYRGQGIVVPPAPGQMPESWRVA